MKQTLLILAIIIFSLNGKAQNEFIKLRHMEGFKSLKVGSTVNLGISKTTHTFLIGYNHYLNKKIFVGADINFEIGKINYSDVHNINLGIYYNYSVYSYKNTLFLNGLAGGFLGNEKSINQEFENNSHSAFVYGLILGINCEIFISNRLCFEPFFTQYLQAGSEMGNAFYNKGLSLKINF